MGTALVWNQLYKLSSLAFPPHRRLRLGMARRHGALRYLFEDQLAVEREILTREYARRVGAVLDLETPKMFTEKVQWRKLFDRRAIFPLLADKLRVRPWVEGRVGSSYLVPLLHAGKSAASTPLETLPLPYIVKPNHSSGIAFPVQAREGQDFKKMRRELSASLMIPCGILGVEWAYWPIDPRIIVETLLLDDRGQVPADCKFHCFGGKAHFVQVYADRFTEPGQVFYDRKWEKIDLEHGGVAAGREVAAPPGLQEMLEVAEALAAGFDYVRVDLYDVDGRIYFGEMTLYPGSGLRPFTPASWDLKWGELWQLPAPMRYPQDEPLEPYAEPGRKPDRLRANDCLPTRIGSG